MQYFARQFIDSDIGIRVVFASVGDFSEADGFLRTILQTAKAADTVASDHCSVVIYANIAAGADLNTCSAADAFVADYELFGLELQKLRPDFVLRGI